MSEIRIMYVGSYATANEPGIRSYEVDLKDGKFSCLCETYGVSNPSYLAVTSKGKYLYSVMEDMVYEGKPGGGVAAFERKGGSLYLLNTKWVRGTLPCHLLVDETNGYLFTANYMSGSVSMFRIEPDGSLGEMCDFKQHEGKGPNAERQEGPHIHFIGFSADETGIWCVDLGLDTIKYYEIDKQRSKLIPRAELDIHLPKGVGPRHFVLNRSFKEIMYVVCELSSEIYVVRHNDTENTILQTTSTTPNTGCESFCAAIKLSEDGRFLYASNRGDDSIAVFGVDSETGRLTLSEITKAQGRIPRDFVLEKDIMVTANQDGNTLSVFRVDQLNGRLAFTGEQIECTSPVCVLML